MTEDTIVDAPGSAAFVCALGHRAPCVGIGLERAHHWEDALELTKPGSTWPVRRAHVLTEPKDHGFEIRASIRHTGSQLNDVGQNNGLLGEAQTWPTHP